MPARSSDGARLTGSQKRPAISSASRNDRRAIFAKVITAKVENIRALMVSEAPHGFNATVAEWMDWRRERISRELQRVEKLSVALLLAEIALHREEGRGETADLLLAAITEGQPIKFRTDRAVVIRIDNGQMFLDLGSAE